MQIHLIDGTYELFRAHFALPAAQSPAGQEVAAVRGLLGSLLALLRRPEVTHLGVAFDHTVESFRNRLFDGYKTAAGVPPELLAQFAMAERAVAALGLVVWPMQEFEADDALATAAQRFAGLAGVEQVLLCSPDKDLAQCVVGQQVVLWDRQRDRVLDEAGVVDKFGVLPASIPDFLALVGDPQDGIPGLPKWGSKSAATLLRHYGSLAAIPDDEGTWAVSVRGAAALANSLREHRREAALYRQLAVLRCDVPLAESLEELRYRGPRPEFAKVCQELGSERLLERVAGLGS